MNDQDKYPYCAAVQDTLIKYRDFDPKDHDGPLGLVLQAYDCSSGCIDETVWDLEHLERSIADKFRLAIIGCLTVRGYDEAAYRVIVEPEYEGCTQYMVFIAGTDEVILRDGCKAWHFGHDDGTLDDLEAFFAQLVESVPRYGVRKYDDVYILLTDVESEIGWACTVDGLAALIGKRAEYRNGEGPDPLDDGDTRWEFAIIDEETEDFRTIQCACGQYEEFPADEQRWHARAFEWLQNVDGRLNNEAIYKCPECGQLVVSECQTTPKEG